MKAEIYLSSDKIIFVEVDRIFSGSSGNTDEG